MQQLFSYKGFLLVLVALLGVAFLLYDPYKPIHSVPPPSTLGDDFDRASLISVLNSQRRFLQSKDPEAAIQIGTRHFPNSWLLRSVSDLLEFLHTDPSSSEVTLFLFNQYDYFQAGGRKGSRGRQMLVTGYYEPLFEGDTKPSSLYRYPLYAPPESLIVQKGSDGSKQVRRTDSNGNFIPFWTRKEIETEQHLVGNELVYLKDPFDSFLLHVQGSGKIQLADGSIKAVGFAGSNGHEYMSIGKILVERNILKLEDVDIPAIRQYLKDNPDKSIELLHQNPRYIFFQWRDNRGPIGSSGEPLTAGRSIAIDPDSLPTGTIGFLESEKPKIDKGKITGWEPLNRLVFPQDTGSAIKGTGRVDLFWGNGDYAEIAASHMKHPGKLYFLIKKGFQEPSVK